MMGQGMDIHFETVRKDDDTAKLEQCRELCNQLMAHQQSKAVIAPEAFDGMNFDTRLAPSFRKSPLKHLVIAKDGETPVGYVFSTIESVSAGDKSTIPPWAPVRPDQRALGFYPDWGNGVAPDMVGCLNQLYITPPYRGAGLGDKLFDMAMAWIEGKHNGIDPVPMTFVYISNGNDAALRFYLERGFVVSHDVYNGFITAAVRQNRYCTTAVEYKYHYSFRSEF